MPACDLAFLSPLVSLNFCQARRSRSRVPTSRERPPLTCQEKTWFWQNCSKSYSEHDRERNEKAKRAGHLLGHCSNWIKPHDGEHDLLQVLEQVLHARHALQQDVQLQPHLNLDGDRGLGLQPEGALVELWIRVHPVLELLCVVGVRQMEMWSRDKCRRLDFALGHVLHPSAQVVPKTGVVRADCSVGENILLELELDCRDPQVVQFLLLLELEAPATSWTFCKTSS